MPELKIRVTEELDQRLRSAMARAKAKRRQDLLLSLLEEWIAAVESGGLQFRAKPSDFTETKPKSGDILPAASKGGVPANLSRLLKEHAQEILDLAHQITPEGEDSAKSGEREASTPQTGRRRIKGN